MRFKQHMPGFCDFEPYDINVNSIKELLNRPEIKRLEKMKGHYRFSITENDGKWSKSCLMHELDNGYTWFVVGYLEMAPELTGLPIWKAKYIADQKRKMAQPVKYETHQYSDSALYQAANSLFTDAFKKIGKDILKDIKKK